MVTVYRVTAVWSGFQGAPGYTKFSFADLDTAALVNAAGAKVRQLFEDTKTWRTTSMSVLVSPNVDAFDVATGALLASSTMTTPPLASTGGAASTAYAGGSGWCVTWNTSLILNRRRVRGRTFFVPAVNAYENDGTLAAAVVTGVTTAANTFLALSAPRPNIWARQFNQAVPPQQTGGSLAPIDSFLLRDMASQLRSRRL